MLGEAAVDQEDQMALALLQKEIEADIAARAEATKLLIAERPWYTAIIRPLFTLLFLLFGFKIVVWDTYGSLGVAPALSRIVHCAHCCLFKVHRAPKNLVSMHFGLGR
jgi:hypothetical protein